MPSHVNLAIGGIAVAVAFIEGAANQDVAPPVIATGITGTLMLVGWAIVYVSNNVWPKFWPVAKGTITDIFELIDKRRNNALAGQLKDITLLLEATKAQVENNSVLIQSKEQTIEAQKAQLENLREKLDSLDGTVGKVGKTADRVNEIVHVIANAAEHSPAQQQAYADATAKLEAAKEP